MQYNMSGFMVIGTKNGFLAVLYADMIPCKCSDCQANYQSGHTGEDIITFFRKFADDNLVVQ